MKRGQTYRCPVCGSETLVIRAEKGALRPVCCNRPMVLLKKRAGMFRCPVCDSEVTVLGSTENTKNLRPVCCNVPMRLLAA